MIEQASPRRLYAILLSLALHGAVVLLLVYHSLNAVEVLLPEQQAINVSLVAPVKQLEPVNSSAALPPVAEKPESVRAEPDSELQAKATPVQADPELVAAKVAKKVTSAVKEKPLSPKPPPKQIQNPHPSKLKSNPLAPQQTTKVAENPFKPIKDTKQTEPQAAPKLSSDNANTIAEGKPLRTTTVQPTYPERALALQQEGRIEVSFDVTSEGDVENIKIISAQPRNMFEHAVKMAVRRWHYQAGRPASNQRVVIQFKLEDGASIN